MKKEYGKLHDRYSELFKTHLDYMERTKSVLGPERLDALQVWSLLQFSWVCLYVVPDYGSYVSGLITPPGKIKDLSPEKVDR